MATATKRTLTIEARLKNYLSKDLNALQRTMGVPARIRGSCQHQRALAEEVQARGHRQRFGR